MKNWGPNAVMRKMFEIKYVCGNSVTHTATASTPYSLKNAGKDCWHLCNSESGFCDYCGKGNNVQKNWGGKGCQINEGGENYHTCITGQKHPDLEGKIFVCCVVQKTVWW